MFGKKVGNKLIAVTDEQMRSVKVNGIGAFKDNYGRMGIALTEGSEPRAVLLLSQEQAKSVLANLCAAFVKTFGAPDDGIVALTPTEDCAGSKPSEKDPIH